MAHTRIQILISWVIIAACASSLSGERIYTVSASMETVASLDNNPQVSAVSLPQDDLFLTYGVYPSIKLNSTGPRSTLRFSYSFGLNRVKSQTQIGFESHAFGGEVSTQLTRNLQLRLSESFTRSADLKTFNLFRGILFTPEGVFFDSETIALRQNRSENTAAIGFEYTVNPQSSLSIAFGHSLRKFQRNLPSLIKQLSDQTGFNGDLRYIKTVGPRTRWELGYYVYQYDFQDFESGRTHNVRVDLSYQISPSVSLSLGTGPSYTESGNSQLNFFSFKNGSLSISKTLEDSLLSLSYSRRSGTSTGVGSLSDAQTLDLNFRRPIGRRTTVSSRLSFYDTQGLLDNPVDIRGLSVSLLFDFLLQDNWVLVLGGSYQLQEGTALYNLVRNRVFVSLRFPLPQLLRFQK